MIVMSVSFYDVDASSDEELDAEDHARLQMINELIEYRMNSMAVSELLITASAYLSQELENRSTGDLEVLYKQLFGEVH
tara:strand:- start:1054 stop:1290 length:237 start_codon:yes stop_codon:yes gene_type:complete